GYPPIGVNDTLCAWGVVQGRGLRKPVPAHPASHLLVRCGAASWLQWRQSALYGMP
ncbi:MAG: hypothetical protein H6R06_4045, partial [Proteobacteria bacterium]|nr:hypothetical protein [Pseudomonadota bacterium]